MALGGFLAISDKRYRLAARKLSAKESAKEKQPQTQAATDTLAREKS